MGLSGSTKKTTENTTQTVTPNAPAYLTQAAQDYVSKVQAFGNGDPASRVVPASELQNQAFNAAGNLGGWQAAANTATSAAQAAGNAPAASAGVSTYNAPTIAGIDPAQAQTYQTQGAGTAAQAQSSSLLDNLDAYQNPYQQQVVDTTLASMDRNAAEVRAQQLADGARNKALGGSRFGVAQALTEADLAQARAGSEANLRAQGFNTAAGLSATDAAARNQTNQFNVGQTNQFALTDASMRDQASKYAADAANQFTMFNSGNDFQRSLSQAGLDASAGQFNAGAQNTANLTNAQLQEQQRQRALQAAGLQADIANSSAGNARADAALQGDLGAQQRAIQNAIQNADLTQLQAQGQLMGMTPYDILVGKTATGSGTSTSKDSGSLFDSILGGASLFL